MDFKQIILENLSRNQAAVAVKVLCSKIQNKFSVAVDNRNVNKQSYSIMNELERDWSTIVFKFKEDGNNVVYEVFVDDDQRVKLTHVRINSTLDNAHHLKLIGQGFSDLVNRLYKLLSQDQEVKANQLKPAFEHIVQVEKYINHDNKLLQKSDSRSAD